MNRHLSRVHVRSARRDVPFLLLLLCVTSALSAAPPLRVLSYNIHQGRGNDGNIDLQRIANVISKAKPDLVALQEVDRKTERSGGVDQLQELATLTGLLPAFGKAIDFEGGQYGVAVLSRFDIAESRVHRLPSTAGHEQRVALAIRVAPSGAALTFVCTHLDHTRDATARVAQVAALNELFASNADGRSVLAGDLNAVPSSPEMKQLMRKWLPASLKSLEGTYPAEDPQRKIDYVMLRKTDAWRVAATSVLDQPVASDHAPLLVELQSVMEKKPDRNLSGIQTIDDWHRRRLAILAAMQEIMGRMPGDEKRCPLDIQIDEEADCGTYVRRLITYASEPGNRVPAYLLIPKTAIEGKETVPAVLCLHPTDNRFGHKVVVGLGGRENRQYAKELAERGFITLAPAYPLLANYQPDWKQLGYASGTMKAIWDNIRGIDLLESLSFVSKDGVGVIGHSLGGHNGVYTAAFDERIKVIVTSCGLDLYRDYMDGDIRGWTGVRYMPRLMDYAHCLSHLPFEFDEIVATLAPRPCFISAPLHDSNFRWQSIDRLAASAASIYRVLAAGDSLRVEHPDCDHDFPDAVRQRAYQLLESRLK